MPLGFKPHVPETLPIMPAVCDHSKKPLLKVNCAVSPPSPPFRATVVSPPSTVIILGLTAPPVTVNALAPPEFRVGVVTLANATLSVIATACPIAIVAVEASV